MGSVKQILRRVKRRVLGAPLSATKQADGVVRIFTQPTDNRGKKLSASIAAGQKSDTSRLWAMLNEKFLPQLCLDVGANYGEVSLPVAYSENQHLYLVEANPYIVRALNRSIASHAGKRRINIIQSFASDQKGEVSFHIDLKWSGTSSAFFQRGDAKYKGEGKQKFETIKTRTVPLDSAIPSARWGGLLMKVDVEGAEMEVLAGAASILDNAPYVFLITEFNKNIIRKRGADPELWFSTLQNIGEVYVIGESTLSLASDLSALTAKGKNDVLVVAHPTDGQKELLEMTF